MSTTETPAGREPAAAPKARHARLIAGAVVLSVLMIGVGIGIGAAIWSGGSSTKTVSAVSNAAPSSAAWHRQPGGPNSGDYQQTIQVFFHPPKSDLSYDWIVFPGPNWGPCAGTEPHYVDGKAPAGKTDFTGNFAFTVENGWSGQCWSNPTDTTFHAHSSAGGGGNAGVSCHFHKTPGRTPSLDCQATALRQGTSRVSVNGYDQVHLYWSADANQVDDNLAGPK